MDTKRRLLNLLVFILVVVVVYTSTVGAAPKLDRLVITSGGVAIPHTPIWIGLEKGIFEKYGLKVELKRVASGFEALAAVQTGDAHVADAVVAVVAQAAEQGINVQAVVMANGDPTGTVATDNYFAIIGNKNKGLKKGNLKSLVGKKIGVPQGTIAHQYLYYALKDNGIDPINDIKIQHVSPADLPSTLQSGSVDAIVCWEPMPLLALDMMKDAIEVYRGGNHVQYVFQRWMKPEFIKNNPDVVKRFVIAFAESAQYVRKYPKSTVEIMARKAQGISKKVIAKSVNWLTFDIRVSKETYKGIEQGLEFAKNATGLNSNYNYKEAIYLDAINYIVHERPDLVEDLPSISSDKKL